MKEKVIFGSDVGVDLDMPLCTLQYEGCQGTATTGYNVHGCAFHYACDSCSEAMMKVLLQSFHKFVEMGMICTSCKRTYELPGYVQVISLKQPA